MLPKIGIYQSYWGWAGGGQYVVAALAESLSSEFDVEVIHHRKDFSVTEIQEALEVDLSRVGFRCVPEPTRDVVTTMNPLARYEAERDFAGEISRPYDLFINHCEMVPFFAHARRALLICAFPFITRSDFGNRSSEEWKKRSLPMRLATMAYQQFEWASRMKTYQVVAANSNFTSGWIRKRWGVDNIVVYPPARTLSATPRKDKLILSVGRFQANKTGQHKKHGVLIDTFKQMCDAGLEGWSYVQLGGFRATPENEEYFAELQERCKGYPVTLVRNATGTELRATYGRASIFWHATGFGEDALTAPDRMEHFGIVTVEAMSAGCVPIVFRGGGQPEIVRQDTDGYLWSDVATLRDSTRRVAEDGARRQAMSRSACERSAVFHKERFNAEFRRIVGNLLAS